MHGKSNSKPKIPTSMPKTTSQVIKQFFKDYDRENDILKISDNRYSVCFEYTDISFSKASQDRIDYVFLKYVDYLNSLNEKVTLQVIHTGIPQEIDEYKKDYLFDIASFDGNEKRIADEMNKLMEKNIGYKDHYYREKRLIVISTTAESFGEAADAFFHYQMRIEEKFKELKSKIRRWKIEERLQLLYDTFNKNLYIEDHPNTNFFDDFEKFDGKIYDYLAPKEDISFKSSKHIKISDDKYVSVMYVKDYPVSLTPKFYNSLTTLSVGNIIITENITPTNPAEVLKRIDKIISDIKTQRLDKAKKAQNRGYSYEMVKDDKLEAKLKSVQELRKALSKKKQKLFGKNTVIVVTAESVKKLDEIKNKISITASQYLVNVADLDWQQLEGVMSALPFGINALQFERTMTSEAAATSTPFNTKTIAHPNSIYYGVDLVSKGILSVDRKLLINGNGCVLATSGAGKSFIIKTTSIEEVFLRYPDDEVIILDLKDEYDPIVEELHGQKIDVSVDSRTFINPFDLSIEYVDENKSPVKRKTEYILAFIESIVGTLTGEQKSIIDRCTKILYEEAEKKNLKPTFPEFYNILTSYKEAEAKNLSLVLERYVKGGLDIFSKETNVEINNRLVSFNLSNLTESMRTTGYLVVLEHIMNRLSKNKKEGKHTWIIIDEFHILLENMYSANYIAKIYKIGRSMGAIPTVITQNIEDVLKSEQGRKILSNSEFALILRQKPLDISPICKIFGISDEESLYVTNSPPGQGLLVYDEDIVPFRLNVPEDYYIYELNQTSLQAKTRD